MSEVQIYVLDTIYIWRLTHWFGLWVQVLNPHSWSKFLIWPLYLCSWVLGEEVKLPRSAYILSPNLLFFNQVIVNVQLLNFNQKQEMNLKNDIICFTKTWILILGSTFGSKVYIWVFGEASGSSVLLKSWVLILMFFNQVKGILNLLSVKQARKGSKTLYYSYYFTFVFLYIIYTKWLFYASYVLMSYIFHVLFTFDIADSTFHMTKCI